MTRQITSTQTHFKKRHSTINIRRNDKCSERANGAKRPRMPGCRPCPRHAERGYMRLYRPRATMQPEITNRSISSAPLPLWKRPKRHIYEARYTSRAGSLGPVSRQNPVLVSLSFACRGYNPADTSGNIQRTTAVGSIISGQISLGEYSADH